MKTRTDYVPQDTDTIDPAAIQSEVARWASLVASAPTSSTAPGQVFSTSSTGAIWKVNIAQQSAYVDTGVFVEHWRCVGTGSSGDYNPQGRWSTLHLEDLGSQPGGIIKGSWCGITYSAQFCAQTADHAYPANPHYLRIRITCGGQNVVYMVNDFGIRTTRFPFSFVIPAGPTELLIEWTTDPLGSDDPDTHTNLGTPYSLPEAHIGPSRLIVELICR
jgi:hypothetical protein